jgi:ornithine carbamoyltransferase
MLMAAKMGSHFTAVVPKGYLPAANVVKMSVAAGKKTGSKIEVVHSPNNGARNADVIYTDVWTSMGQETEKEKRLKDFRGFQINGKLMAAANASAIFMHCLPAHRGEEVTDEVMDSPQSVVFNEAENRLHTQKAVMATLVHPE